MPNPDILSFDTLRNRLAGFDTIIDARSPGEFAEDHLPGAINHAVLQNDERALVGTLHKQSSAFDARKVGAVLVSRNIATIVSGPLAAMPQPWKPLIYCWRGGQRSAALAHVLARIGWHVTLLEGGYKAYRRAVIDDLEILPQRFDYRVVCGPTGSGKSRLLRTLADQGAQVLDLERLACHRGSVLGGLPDAPQPGQRAFESTIWHALAGFSTERPIYVEAESKRIGKLRVPEQLMLAMRAAACIALELPATQRVTLLMDEYRHLIEGHEQLIALLDPLTDMHGHATVDTWSEAVREGQWPWLVADLLAKHYDPAYQRSTSKNYRRLGEAHVVHLQSADQAAFDVAARNLMTRG